MARSPLQSLTSFSIPIHLNILGWGAIAAAAYALSPDVYESGLVQWAVMLFGFLYTVVAVILLSVRIGAPEAARPIPMLSPASIAMALVGAGLLLFVSVQVGGVAGRGLALAAPVVGALCGIVSAASLRRQMRER